MPWDAYTKLMLHCDGAEDGTTFTDEIGKTVTVVGNSCTKQTLAKFGTGAAKFDGDSGMLSIAAHATDWDFAAGDFTIEFWFTPTAAAKQAIFCGNTDFWLGINFHMNGTRNIAIWASSNGTSWDLINADAGGNGIGSASLSLNVKHHVALVRHGDNWLTFLDGTKDIDITKAGTVINRAAEAKVIGRWGAAADRMWNSGIIDEFRITKGLARWTANFTPPTSAYTTDANTVFLSHFDGADGATSFTDECSHTITTTADVVNPGGPKFGTACAYLDGTGDYLEVPASADFDVGSGNFTIDFWFKTFTTKRVFFFALSSDYHYGLDYNSVGTQKLGLWASSNGSSWNMINSDAGGNGICATTISLNQWNHIAIVRNGNNWLVFLNGVKDLDITVAGTVVDSSGENFRIGRHGSSTTLNVQGYLDEFRFSKGIARWTEAFTPPLVPYAADILVVATAAASNIGYTTVTLNGELTTLGTGDTSVAVSIEYGPDTSYGSEATADESPLAAPGAFHADLTGLSDGQTYHFRAKAVGDVSGTVYGDDVTFSTSIITVPTVTTSAATSIGQSVVILNGNITSVNGDNAYVRGFAYSTDSDALNQYIADGTDPYNLVEIVSEIGDFGSGVYTLDVSGLWAGTTYYFASVAFNSAGAGFGSPLNFTTLDGYPFSEPELSDDDTFIYNECDIVPASDNTSMLEQDFADGDYQEDQGPRVLTKNNSLIAITADATKQAWIAVDRYKNSKFRADSILILPDKDPDNLYPLVLGFDLSTRIILQINSTRNPALLNQAYHIEGIEHEWSRIDGMSDKWQTRWQLWDVSQYKSFTAVHDGYVENQSVVSYADCHDASSANQSPVNDGDIIRIGQRFAVGPSRYIIDRGLLQFDTTNILSSDTILEAHLLLYVRIPIETWYYFDSFELWVTGADTCVNPLSQSDYHILLGQTTDYGHITADSPVSNNHWIDITLTAAGLAAITKAGITHLGLRTNHDISNESPTAPPPAYAQYIEITGKANIEGFKPILIVRVA